MTSNDPKRPRLDPTSSESKTPNQNSNQSAVPGPTLNYRPVGQPTPHINPKVFRPGDMASMRGEQVEARHKDSLCKLCSNTNREVCHPHFSTKQLRDFAAKYRSLGTFNCPICKKEEPIERPTNVTIRLLLSSSTLYNIWENPKIKDKHFEMEAVVGGRVRDLTRALDRLYLSKLPNRLEIIAVCTINNIGDGQPPEEIVADMMKMKALVAEHSEIFQHEIPSFVSFATCIQPPKFCSFTVPADVPELRDWIPQPNFINRAEAIETLNKQIKEMNSKEGLNYVGLHMWGMKFFKSGMKQHKFDTKEGAKQIWRETDVRRKLHFTHEVKLQVMATVMKIFDANSKDKF